MPPNCLPPLPIARSILSTLNRTVFDSGLHRHKAGTARVNPDDVLHPLPSRQ
jgi:hypothetical protein